MEKSENIVSVQCFADSLTRKANSSKSDRISTFFRQQVISKLSKLEFGQLTLLEDEHKETFFGSSHSDIKAEITVKDPQFYRYIALGGSVGAGEAYINGYWQSTNLTDVIRLFAVNQQSMDQLEKGYARFTTPIKKVFHWLNKNTESGSKKNIVAHYDLGNDFFEAFLDPTMMYSAGIFDQNHSTMEQASVNKLQRICDRLRLKPNDHLIEIGTGWGTMAIYAATKFGCKVTTTTISDEQYQHVKQRIRELGLEKKITLLKKDYRQLTGKYDKLVSVEMIEAVGHHYYNSFFKKCNDLLKPNGEMLLQAITIADQRFDSARKEIDFIKRYIFPGSCIPSINAISEQVTASTDMRIQALDDIGIHYAETLRYWRKSFFSNIDKIRSMGYSDSFIRMWEFYLCYCEGGFRERVISDVQVHLVKPMARVPATLPSL